MNKNTESIIKKLGIEKLNPMQEETALAVETSSDIILLSPTGSGKTVAFLLPIIDMLDADCKEVQALILVPSRELAIQIEQVAREMGTGYKTNAVYGGRAGAQDRIDLQHRPAILIGTPGRVADHINKESFSTNDIKILVLDEFDKSLEVGFEPEMIKIIESLHYVQKRILTSATYKVKIPKFVGLKNPLYVNYQHEKITQLEIKTVLSPDEDKLETLLQTLQHIGSEPGIVFCNLKDTIQDVSDFLYENGISHGVFHGSMEQRDRELSLLKFRNGTHKILLATDLAARGIDIPEMKFIIHFELPPRDHEFTHRNGRTARMNSNGTAYVLQYEGEKLPGFIRYDGVLKDLDYAELANPTWETLHISGGRRDKISKGDIAGLFFKKGNLNKDELGIIEVKPDCSYVAVPISKASKIIDLVNNSKLKKKKVRVSVIY